MSKINLPIAELKPALTGLGKIIQKRTTLPVLGCIRIERTKDGWIALTGTDLDAFVTVRLEEPAAGEQTSVLVPFDDLAKIAKGCSGGETITLEHTGKQVIVHYPVGQQSAQIKVESIAVEEFPPIPKIKTDAVPLNDEIRKSLLEAFECASTDQTRYILQGAYIDVSDRKCQQVIATDGRHLYGSNSFSLPLNQSVIIPTNKFLEWKEFNADGEWQLRMQPEKGGAKGYMQISSRRWRFIHQQIEGQYPNWRQVLPTKFKTTIEFTSAEAQSVVPRLPLDSSNANKPVGLKIERNRVYLLGRSSIEDKWTQVEIEGVKIAGAPVTIYLNRDFLMKAFTFGFTKLEIVDERTAMKFSSNGKYLIVMPVRGEEAPTTTPAKAPAPPPATSSAKPQEEPHGNGEAGTADSETSNERSTMARTSTNGHPNGHQQDENQPVTIDTALEQIETIKGSYREAIRGLNTLTDTLKQVQRGQRSAEKEVQSVRTTLEKLQTLKI